MKRFFFFAALLLICTHSAAWSQKPASAGAPAKRAMTFDDAMKFRGLEQITLSADGKWLGYVERPDRGDPVLVIQSLEGKPQTHTIPRGSRVVFSRDARWAAVTIAPKYLAAEKAKPDARPDNALSLLELGTGKQTTLENVGKSVFSEDSRWIAVHFTKNRKEPKTTKTAAAKDSVKPAPKDAKESVDTTAKKATTTAAKGAEKGADKTLEKKPEAGTMLLLRSLSETVSSPKEFFVPFVKEVAFDSLSTTLALATLDTNVRGAVLMRSLSNGSNSSNLSDTTVAVVDSAAQTVYSSLSWSGGGNLAGTTQSQIQSQTQNQRTAQFARCAFVRAAVSTTNIIQPASLHVWEASARALRTLMRPDDAPKDWVLPSKNTLTWSPDGARLLFGFKPVEIHRALTVKEPDAAADTLEVDVYNPAKILKTAEVDVWKWDDPFINIHQKKLWEQAKDRIYTASWDASASKYTLLATREMPSVEFPELGGGENPVALGRRDAPYRQEITWDDNYFDAHIINVKTADTTRFAAHLQYECSLSPNGQFALYYRDKNWFLYDIASKKTRNLTDGIKAAFWDEDDDHPAAKPSHGLAGWVVGVEAGQQRDKAVIVYDKFDLWQIPTSGGEAMNLTAGEGRKKDYTLRAVRLDTTRKHYTDGEPLLLSAYHDRNKSSAYYSATVGKAGVKLLLADTTRRFARPVKAQNASTLVFQQMDYAQFPDVWQTDVTFKAPKRVTDLQKQVEQFAWGTSELVEWTGPDGKPLQGVLIKPGNYQAGKRYPVMVYFYELFSDRLNDFQMPSVGSRPAFGLYASNGYVIFLPDVRYAGGTPGQNALQCIMPGVRKLIAMGVADSTALGIHGHSWSGYQAMYMITQTNAFKAAIVGAAVANMTSAYGGIRYGTGLARMFQYERSQSRLGSTLWERRDLYIDNSPLFFADRINTKTLMMFGDDDDAVPWTQGIEMYLAMRRLGKECHFLQYRKEPHHPRKYANRYDYAVKMKEYFDHYLKSAPAADWIRSGVPYMGK